MKRTVRVDEEVWLDLFTIKYSEDYKSLSDVIRDMIKEKRKKW